MMRMRQAAEWQQLVAQMQQEDQAGQPTVNRVGREEGRAHTFPRALGRWRRGPGRAEAGARRLAAAASANSSALPARIGAAASR
uniref:Uncharacterized protein n=1 Tax=Rangifer tarandus platyrhynchus TaxID=3082113 RepID=A0ACB0DTC2_RANTA|nr:unnamed protein product [Rangifer tarandus platyrhynchus]